MSSNHVNHSHTHVSSWSSTTPELNLILGKKLFDSLNGMAWHGMTWHRVLRLCCVHCLVDASREMCACVCAPEKLLQEFEKTHFLLVSVAVVVVAIIVNVCCRHTEHERECVCVCTPLHTLGIHSIHMRRERSTIKTFSLPKLELIKK